MASKEGNTDLEALAERELPRICFYCKQFTFMGNPAQGKCHHGAKPGLMVGKDTSGFTDARLCSAFQWGKGWLASLEASKVGWLETWKRKLG